MGKSHGGRAKNPLRLLGDLELEVMKVLWNKGEATGKEAWEDIRALRKTALTTVLTVLERLSTKGFVRRFRNEGVYIYTPSVSREDYTREVSGRMLKDYMDLSSSSLMASFIDALDDVSDDEVEKLSRLIEKKRKERG